VLRTQQGLRLLGPDDLPAMEALTARDPVVNVFVDYRARLTRLDPRWLGGEVWGYHVDGVLVAACHAAANLVPVAAGPAAAEAFAARAAAEPRRCATLVGPAEQVDPMWDRLSRTWGPGREVRRHQPHLEIRSPSGVAPDPGVRRTGADDLEVLYPACVAMYTEEVGVSPEAGGGATLYRARVAQLISKRWSFARIEDDRVVFKAEVAAATPHACQVQGVWVAPERRGEGLATAGMAAVVQMALADVAPVVSLYVNEHNVAARRVYDAVGFTQTAEFTTVMF
jgi:predicted GNAT family acetyltransferase